MTSAVNHSVLQPNNSTDLPLKKPDGDPFVRYTTTDGEGLTQTPLRPIEDVPPNGAIFESLGVYFATDSQLEGQSSKNIQHECRQDGRAFYRVVAESDALEDGEKAPTVLKWLIEFAEEYLGLGEDEYGLYFSGNRSIHLETSRWTDAEGWQGVRELARAFNDETEGELDTAIYSTLPQWRRIGVTHEKTGLSKVAIDPEDDRSAIVSKAISADREGVLGEHTSYVAGVASRESLVSEIEDRGFRPLINPSSTDDRIDPTSPVSPYALTEDGRRSLIVFRPFVNPCERTDGNQHVFGRVLEAIGADRNYRRSDSCCDVLLSDRDAAKWSIEPGTRVAIIGGQSRSSRLIELTQDEAMTVSEAIQDEGIDAGFRRLKALDHDVGTAARRDENYRPDDPSDRSEAALLQSSIEAGDRDPSYPDVFGVSCRLLRLRGWRETVEWIEGIYGDEFDAGRTHSHLTGILEAYPETYDVDPPEAPIDPSAGS